MALHLKDSSSFQGLVQYPGFTAHAHPIKATCMFMMLLSHLIFPHEAPGDQEQHSA